LNMRLDGPHSYSWHIGGGKNLFPTAVIWTLDHPSHCLVSILTLPSQLCSFWMYRKMTLCKLWNFPVK
jgi:hypothetical protein